MKKRNIIHSIIFFVLILIVICLSYSIGVERTKNYYSFRSIRGLIDDRVLFLMTSKMGRLENLEIIYERELGILLKSLENSYLDLQKSNRFLPSVIDYKTQLSTTLWFLEGYYDANNLEMSEDTKIILTRIKEDLLKE